MKNLSAYKKLGDKGMGNAQGAILSRLREDLLLGVACPIIVDGKSIGIESDLYSVQMADNGYVFCEFDEPAILSAGENYLLQSVYAAKLSMNHFGTSAFQDSLRELLRTELGTARLPQSERVNSFSIRPLLLDDAKRVFDFLRNEKAVIEDTGFEWHPSSVEDTLLWLRRSAPLHTIAVRDDGEVVGVCGVMPDLCGIPGTKSVSLFYAVGTGAQGNGIAGAMVVEGIKTHQDVHPEYTHAVIHTELHNIASKAVARKLGFQRDESTDYRSTSHGKPCTVYGSSARIDDAIGFYLVGKIKDSMSRKSRAQVPPADKDGRSPSANLKPTRSVNPAFN